MNIPQDGKQKRMDRMKIELKQKIQELETSSYEKENIINFLIDSLTKQKQVYPEKKILRTN